MWCHTKLPSLLSTPGKAPGWKYKTATRSSSFLAPLDLEEIELLQGNLVSGVKLSRAGYEKVIFKRQNSSLWGFIPSIKRRSKLASAGPKSIAMLFIFPFLSILSILPILVGFGVEVEMELGMEDAMGALEGEEDSGLVVAVQAAKAPVARDAIATKPML